LVVGEQQTHPFLQSGDSAHQQNDVQLQLQFLLSVVVDPHRSAVLETAEETRAFVEKVNEKVHKVELVGVYALVAAVSEEFAAHTDIVTDFVVETHNENQSQDCADESSDVGEKLVDFLEASVVSYLAGGFDKNDLEIEVTRCTCDLVLK